MSTRLLVRKNANLEWLCLAIVTMTIMTVLITDLTSPT